MNSTDETLASYRGRVVVLDLSGPFVVLGCLTGYDERYMELEQADVHDLRDCQNTREFYIADAVDSGVKVNRRRVLIPREQIVSISLLDDFIS